MFNVKVKYVFFIGSFNQLTSHLLAFCVIIVLDENGWSLTLAFSIVDKAVELSLAPTCHILN